MVKCFACFILCLHRYEFKFLIKNTSCEYEQGIITGFFYLQQHIHFLEN